MSEPKPGVARFQPAWSYQLAHGARGLALARERNWLLAWDTQHRLYLLNHAGEVQAQRLFPGVLTAACCADDGSAYAAVSERGEVQWLAPDLMPRWQRTVPHRAVGAALDSLGQYLLVADSRGQVHAFDRLGRSVGRIESPRPLCHLSFAPAAAAIVGAADFGLVGCFDLAGKWHWRDGPVSHIGSLAVRGDGGRVVLACFTQGLQTYHGDGTRPAAPAVTWPCRLAALSYDGRLTLVAWLNQQLLLIDPDGQNLCTHPFEEPIVALALGALGTRAVAALASGTVQGLKVS
jgi:hypothetical protein